MFYKYFFLQSTEGKIPLVPLFSVYLLCFRGSAFPITAWHKKRAIDESRTHDLFLTKEALYH